MAKTYKTNYASFTTCVVVNGKQVSIDFKGGVPSLGRPSLYVAHKKEIQDAIENSKLFNNIIFLYDTDENQGAEDSTVIKKQTEQIETKKEQEVIENKPDSVGETIVVPEVTTYQQAKEYLLRYDDSINPKDLLSRKQIILLANKLNIVFPNLK